MYSRRVDRVGNDKILTLPLTAFRQRKSISLFHIGSLFNFYLNSSYAHFASRANENMSTYIYIYIYWTYIYKSLFTYLFSL